MATNIIQPQSRTAIKVLKYYRYRYNMESLLYCDDPASAAKIFKIDENIFILKEFAQKLIRENDFVSFISTSDADQSKQSSRSIVIRAIYLIVERELWPMDDSVFYSKLLQIIVQLLDNMLTYFIAEKNTDVKKQNNLNVDIGFICSTIHNIATTDAVNNSISKGHFADTAVVLFLLKTSDIEQRNDITIDLIGLLSPNAHEEIALSRTGYKSTPLYKLTQNIETYKFIDGYIPAFHSRAFLTHVSNSLLELNPTTVQHISKTLSTLVGDVDNGSLQKYVISLCKLWRRYHRLDVISIDLPKADILILHALLQLIIQGGRILSETTPKSQNIEFTDEAFIILYRVCLDALKSSFTSIQECGYLVLYHALSRVNTAVILSMTPAIHADLSQASKSIQRTPLNQIISHRCLSTVNIMTSSTKASLYYSNQLIMHVHSSILLFRNHTTAFPLLVALYPSIIALDKVIIASNLDVLIELYLSCLNIWHVPLQYHALLGVSALLHRCPDELRIAADVILGELIRVYTFYSRGNHDLSMATGEEKDAVMALSVRCGTLLCGAAPSSFDATIDALSSICVESSQFLDNVKSLL